MNKPVSTSRPAAAAANRIIIIRLPSNALSVSQKPNMAIRTTRIRKMTSGMKGFLSVGGLHDNNPETTRTPQGSALLDQRNVGSIAMPGWLPSGVHVHFAAGRSGLAAGGGGGLGALLRL